MAVDIASLGIRVDLRQVNNAVRDLRQLTTAANAASRATSNINFGLGGASNNLSRMAYNAESVSSSMSKAAKSMMAINRGGAFLYPAYALGRAVKSMMAMVAAYDAFDRFKDFVNIGLEFNSTMETSKVAIGVLIAGMTKLGDAQGRVFEGMEKYVKSQEMAKKLIVEIQKEALQTTTTTKELMTGMQVITGPALRAGVKLEDMPHFAGIMSRALQTIGLPMNQMRTEIESILSGTTNAAQDMLAPILYSEIKGGSKERNKYKYLEDLL